MSRSAKKAREIFRKRLLRLHGLDNGARAIADAELGAFLGTLTRRQAEKIADQFLWFLEPLDRALIVGAALGDPALTPERRRALVHEGVREDRREALEEAITEALKTWHPEWKGPTR